MKRILLLLSLAVFAATGCVDDSYDLSDIDTDSVTIGGEEEFKLPLATVTIKVDELKNNDRDIVDLFGEADIWLPSAEETIEVDRIVAGDDEYIDDLLTALIVEMSTDPEKLNAVAELIAYTDEYRYKFSDVEQLKPLLNEKEKFKSTFVALFSTTDILQEITRNKAHEYLADLQIEPVSYSLGEIDLSSDVIKMLTDNLGGDNVLAIYGTAYSTLPVSVSSVARFSYAPNVKLEVDLEPNQSTEIGEARLTDKDDLVRILSGTPVEIPVDLKTYYPKIGFNNDQEIVLTLKLLKTGGLKIEL